MCTYRRLGCAWCSIVLTIILLTSTLQAQELSPALEQEAHTIFGEVLSPYCPGRSLNDCPSGDAAKLKDEIRHQLVEGKSRQQVIDLLFTRFGESIRARPRTEGFAALAWLMPISFLMIGFIIALTWLLAKRSPGVVEGQRDSLRTQGVSLDPAMQARITQELEHFSE